MPGDAAAPVPPSPAEQIADRYAAMVRQWVLDHVDAQDATFTIRRQVREDGSGTWRVEHVQSMTAEDPPE